MFSGPMFRREYQASTRRRRPFATRSVLVLMLGTVALVIGLIVFHEDLGQSSRSGLTLFGSSVFLATIIYELLLLVFFVPTDVAGSIAEEREKDTLPLLLLTRLTPFQIATTKMFARWLPATDPILVGLPVLVASAWVAGHELEAVLAMLMLTSSSAFMASLAILASSRREQVGTARAQAIAWAFGWLIGPPIVTIMPIPTGSLWGELLDALKWPCMIVAPSSPVSLVTDAGWYNNRPGALGLVERVGLMVGLQMVFGLMAIGLATGGLKAREKNPNWLDPTRGHRPPCGDDPIFWREFELPMRRGAGPLILLRLRYVWILIQAILISLLTLVGTLLALAVPIGLLVATIYYGSAAFRELWNHGYGANGPFDARGHFNMLIRAATGMLCLLPTLGVSTLVSTKITTERDKKTWDAFLTTPLDGEEILRSKARVALNGLWHTAWPLPLFWVLGLACGVILPLGVALATVDLLILVWANVALGLMLGIRPGTTSSASNWSAWSMLGFLAIHAPLLWAALVSPCEFAEFTSWDFRLRLGLVLAALAVPVLTGATAWYWTRRTRDRFDEWVGRPVKSGRINPP
jgi:hypothetical protein